MKIRDKGESLQKTVVAAVVPKKRKRSPKKNEPDLDDIQLSDPTSVTLMNSFLIKSAGPSFETFHQAMKQGRRR